MPGSLGEGLLDSPVAMRTAVDITNGFEGPVSFFDKRFVDDLNMEIDAWLRFRVPQIQAIVIYVSYF